MDSILQIHYPKLDATFQKNKKASTRSRLLFFFFKLLANGILYITHPTAQPYRLKATLSGNPPQLDSKTLLLKTLHTEL